MKSNKLSLGISIVLTASITATIAIPITVNFTKNNSINNNNEINVTIDGSSYEVSADAIIKLVEQSQELNNKNENLQENNKELQENNKKLQEKIEDLENQLKGGSGGDGPTTVPTKDSDELALNMEPFHSNRTQFNTKQIKDRLGNEFNTAIVLGNIKLLNDKKNRNYNLEYNLNSMYSSVSGILAFSEDNTRYRSEQLLYLDIYADYEYVETFGPIGEKTDPIKFNIPIPNPKFIEFVTYTSDNRDWDITYDIDLIIDELQFHK